MGCRIEQPSPLRIWSCRALLFLLWACATVRPHVSNPKMYATFRINNGSPAEFANVSCYSVLEVVDDDERDDVARFLRRYLADANPPMRQCDGAAARLLRISYQGGRGVCIDCLAPGKDWSGFAFITVNEATGREVATAEWIGGGARNGRELVIRFAEDLVRVTRAGSP